MALYEQLRAKPVPYELGLGQPLLCRIRGLLCAHLRDGSHQGLANFLMVQYEIIRHDVNGYIVPCHYQRMHDNDQGLFESAHFTESHLVHAFCKFAMNRDYVERLKESTKRDYAERFDIEEFEERFIHAIFT